MKKIMCVFLSALLCCVMLLNIVSYAATTNAADEGYLVYDSLDANMKAIYNAFAQQPFSEDFVVTLPVPLEYDNVYSDYPDAFYTDISPTITAGIFGFAYDHPEYLWFYTFSSGVVHYTRTLKSDGKYHIVIDQIRVKPKLKTAFFSNNADLQTKTAEMMSVINSIEIKGNTRYEKLKSIHDTVISMTTYDPNVGTSTEAPAAHFPSGVFLAPHTAVCEGYATAFKMLCDKANIPCIVVIGKLHGGGHAWDYVKMEDGKWYAVDCTRDDNSAEYIYYDDFLTGTDATASHFDDQTTKFSDSHVADGKLWTFTNYSFQYPTCSAEPFTKMILSANSKAIITTDRTTLIIPANSDIYNEAEGPQGYMIMVAESKTGENILLSNFDGTSNFNYKLIMRGDVVADAKVDATDYNKVRQTAGGFSDGLTPNTDTYTAGDMNGDGVVDGFDMFLVDKAITETAAANG